LHSGGDCRFHRSHCPLVQTSSPDYSKQPSHIPAQLRTQLFTSGTHDAGNMVIELEAETAGPELPVSESRPDDTYYLMPSLEQGENVRQIHRRYTSRSHIDHTISRAMSMDASVNCNLCSYLFNWMLNNMPKQAYYPSNLFTKSSSTRT